MADFYRNQAAELNAEAMVREELLSLWGSSVSAENLLCLFTLNKVKGQLLNVLNIWVIWGTDQFSFFRKEAYWLR